MSTRAHPGSATAENRVPPLENGDLLSAGEFLRRYEAMSDLKKAELVRGITYMASPVRADVHAEPDGLIQMWLGYYAGSRSGVRHLTNATLRLGPDDVPQPDAILFRDADHGGRAKLDENGYLTGPPELVVEIAASSVSRDARDKLASYRRAAVTEYLLWRVEDGALDWHFLDGDEYRLLEAEDGVLKSRIFPGLWLDAASATARERPAVLDTLRRGLDSD